MTREVILVLNAGSSSIKFFVFGMRDGAPRSAAEDEPDGDLEPLLNGQIEGLYASPHFIARDASGAVTSEHAWGDGVALGHDGAIAYLAEFFRGYGSGLQLLAVGHRVVHGGPSFAQPVRLNREVLAELERLVPLAPLHQTHNLKPIELLLERRPELPQVACFDTAFHSTNPDLAQRFAIPAELHDAGVRRYGFHGLSYEYIASVLPLHDARAAAGRTVVCHLGNGSSMCVLLAGKSIASTMGFTALDGLPMGTRCGALDPGVLLYLMDERGMDARAIESLLYLHSGLLGVSGISSDMRKLADSSEPGARLAIDLFVYRIRRELGSLAAAVGGLDALVFTAGIGENSASIRERVCGDAQWLGVEFDATANAQRGPRISTPASRVSAWVIPTNEELMIARHTHRLLDD
jgi:acetate kinase